MNCNCNCNIEAKEMMTDKKVHHNEKMGKTASHVILFKVLGKLCHQQIQLQLFQIIIFQLLNQLVNWFNFCGLENLLAYPRWQYYWFWRSVFCFHNSILKQLWTQTKIQRKAEDMGWTCESELRSGISIPSIRLGHHRKYMGIFRQHCQNIRTKFCVGIVLDHPDHSGETIWKNVLGGASPPPNQKLWTPPVSRGEVGGRFYVPIGRGTIPIPCIPYIQHWGHTFGWGAMCAKKVRACGEKRG